MQPIPVTRGDGRHCFCLFVPISFADMHLLRGFDAQAVTVPGKSVSVRIEGHMILLQVRDFATAEEANCCFDAIHSAVLRAVASRRASAHVAPLGDIERLPDNSLPNLFERKVYEPWTPRTPETDGIIWRMRSYVLPDHERILLMPTATGRIIREITPAVLTQWFSSSVRPQQWPLSHKDELALAVIEEANAQRSARLEFLGLVNALEILIEDKPLTAAQQQLVSQWKRETDEAATRAREMNDTRRAQELEELRNRLNFINSSIQGGLRRVFDDVAAVEPPDPATNVQITAVDSLSEPISEIYAVRSELTHSGRVRDKGGVEGIDRLRRAASVTRYLVHCVFTDRLK